MAAKVRKNDTVQVLAGRDKGKQGKVTRVIPKEDRVVIEGVNIRKRHTRARRPGEQAGIVEFFDLNGSTRPPSLTRHTQ